MERSILERDDESRGARHASPFAPAQNAGFITLNRVVASFRGTDYKQPRYEDNGYINIETSSIDSQMGLCRT